MTPTGDDPAVRLRAPAKLTLSLRVTGVQPDGLHTIDAEMVGVDLYDDLELRPTVDGVSRLELVDTAAAAGVTAGADNLVLRALALTGHTAAVRLRKRIPSEAGLGGGSADAAAVLRWAGMTDPTVAARLGADVAFCLVGGRARVTGFGEVIEPLDFVPLTFTLFTPPVRCPTGAVFQAWDELGGPTGSGVNDLEPAALLVAPDLRTWRDGLARATGETPQLAGSGSTWFVPGAHPGPGRHVVHTVPAH
ncbi:MAG: 4-(cytidine 5'-diphospho)-2-C-methyl-D-erythritol kinase [Acidimicrobiales bacterium]